MATERKILKKMPQGWKVRKGATTAPIGYVWVYNGKSRFGGEYEQALVPESEVKDAYTNYEYNINYVVKVVPSGKNFYVETYINGSLMDKDFFQTKSEANAYAKQVARRHRGARLHTMDEDEAILNRFYDAVCRELGTDKKK